MCNLPYLSHYTTECDNVIDCHATNGSIVL